MSAENCPQIRARQTRDIRIEPMLGMFPSPLCQRIGGYRVRDSESPLYVAGQRIKIFLALFPLRSILTRRPAPGVLPVGIARRKLYRREFVSPIEQPSVADIQREFAAIIRANFALNLRKGTACYAPLKLCGEDV